MEPIRKIRKIRKVVISAAILLLAAGFGACNKDDDDVFTPDANLTREQIIELVAQARMASLVTAPEITIEISGKFTSNAGGGSYSSLSQSRNRNTRKMYIEAKSSIQKDNLSVTNYEYTEDFKQYSYTLSGGKLTKTSRNLTDAYWNEFTYYLENFKNELIGYTWKVEGNTLVGTEIGTSVTYTYTLNSNKQLASVKGVYPVAVEQHNGTMEEEAVYTYSANPVPTAAFKKEDFTAIAQYKLTVVWNEGKGTNVFYADLSGATEVDFPVSDARSYAPQIAGKTPEFYTDAHLIEGRVSSSVTLTDNNTTLYVKWISTTSQSIATRRERIINHLY
jgi:hypothetical protein